MSHSLQEIYTIENVPVFEAIYGSGLISLGGYDAINKMFDGLSLENQCLLDVGFGIGGMAYYLAYSYACKVVGIEKIEWMPSFAKVRAPAEIEDRVYFTSYNADGTMPFVSRSINLAYSKGVLTNVADKPALFSEVFRVLCPGGCLCLIDWLVPVELGVRSEKLPMGDTSYKETEHSYQKILTASGFKRIEYLDVSEEYLSYVKSLGNRLISKEHRKLYKDVIDESLREQLIVSNNSLRRSIESGQQCSVRIRALKPLGS